MNTSYFDKNAPIQNNPQYLKNRLQYDQDKPYINNYDEKANCQSNHVEIPTLKRGHTGRTGTYSNEMTDITRDGSGVLCEVIPIKKSISHQLRSVDMNNITHTQAAKLLFSPYNSFKNRKMQNYTSRERRNEIDRKDQQNQTCIGHSSCNSLAYHISKLQETAIQKVHESLKKNDHDELLFREQPHDLSDPSPQQNHDFKPDESRTSSNPTDLSLADLRRQLGLESAKDRENRVVDSLTISSQGSKNGKGGAEDTEHIERMENALVSGMSATESLLRSRRAISDAITISTDAHSELISSTNTLKLVHDDSTKVQSTLKVSSTLVNKHERKAKMEKLYIRLAFSFFVLVVVYIIIKRLPFTRPLLFLGKITYRIGKSAVSSIVGGENGGIGEGIVSANAAHHDIDTINQLIDLHPNL